MSSHPIEESHCILTALEWALYVFLSYTGNFTKLYLERDSNYTLRHISGSRMVLA